MTREERLAYAQSDDPLRDQTERRHAQRIRDARAAWVARPRRAYVDRDDVADAQFHVAALTEMLIKLGVVQKVDFLEALAEVYERAAREGL